MRALAVHALVELGRPLPAAAAAALYTGQAELSPFARALVLLALLRVAPADARVNPLADGLLAQLSELPATAHLKESLQQNLAAVFDSKARTEAVILLALLRVRPPHPLVIKLARGLLARRRGDGWRNTQENAYALLALSEFAQFYEKETPQLVASAWLGTMPLWQQYLGGHGEPAEWWSNIPMAQLLGQATPGITTAIAVPSALPLILQRNGRGRLYVRVGLEWALPDTAQTQSTRTFTSSVRCAPEMDPSPHLA